MFFPGLPYELFDLNLSYGNTVKVLLCVLTEEKMIACLMKKLQYLVPGKWNSLG